ncbi:hypothetical protein ScPMuIL_000708 [Solemya velum]
MKPQWGVVVLVLVFSQIILVYKYVSLGDWFRRRTTNVTTEIADGNSYNTKQIPPNATIKQLNLDDRASRVKEMCRQLEKESYPDLHKSTGRMLRHSKRDMMYCVTPKAGCTSWIRIMRFLNGDIKQGVHNPLEVDRMYVHYGPLQNTKVYDLHNETLRKEVSSKGYKFMFARNPYSRLYSAYIDKIFLPDYWRSAARPIVKKRPNVTESHQQCPDDISFAEFTKFVVDSITKKSYVNEHWAPVTWICNPCEIPFDYVGTQETFSSDTKYLLEHFGIGDILPSQTFSDRINEEIETLITYNFDLVNQLPKGCVKENDLARRLWKTFQINGYIPENVQHSFNSPEAISKKEFHELVLNTIKENFPSKEEWKKRRNKALREAFGELSAELLINLRKVYDIDIQLYGYDPLPKELIWHIAT